jgi:hypothetical protein
MRVDQLFLDLLDWIKRVLVSKQDKAAHKPYEILKQYRGRQGILKLVVRDTPRAVRTYIFSPFQETQTNRIQVKKDIHICLDHLWQSAQTRSSQQNSAKAQKSRSRFANSHRITVFEASRFLNKDGTYDTNQIYSEDLNLVGKATYRDQLAIPIVDDLAMMLKEFPVNTIDWKFEIETGCKRYLGSHWKPSQSQDLNAV